jgi:hypothetical protein
LFGNYLSIGNFAACYTRQSVFSVTAVKLFLCCIRHLQVRKLTLSRPQTEVGLGWVRFSKGDATPTTRQCACFRFPVILPRFVNKCLRFAGDALLARRRFRPMPRTPKNYHIRLEVRKKSNPAIPIHFLTFCKQLRLPSQKPRSFIFATHKSPSLPIPPSPRPSYLSATPLFLAPTRGKFAARLLHFFQSRSHN